MDLPLFLKLPRVLSVEKNHIYLWLCELKQLSAAMQVEARIRPLRGLKPLKGAAACAACGEEGGQALRQEVERLRDQLASTRDTILRMHEREERVKQRSADN